MRTPNCDKNGLKKGTWTPEEDKKLVAYVTRYGCWNWRQLPKFAGLARCGKSCRLRWLNYLRPNIKRGNYSQEEEETIIGLHEKLGNRWSVIAAHLPGRTDNEIKNHWHTILKKRFEQNSFTPETVNAKVTESKNNSPVAEEKQLEKGSENNNIVPDTAAAAAPNQENLALEDDDLVFLDAYIEPVSLDSWTEPYLTDISYVPSSEATTQFVFEPEHFFSPMNDVEPWSQNNLYQEYGDLFH